jgi:hypothetical protein
MRQERSMKCLVYGPIPRGPEQNLVFLPEDEAFRLASIFHAIESARTWGDFRDLMPPDDFDAIEAFMATDGDLCDLNERFRWEDLPGYCDGLFPDWAEQRMLQWLPEKVTRRFGRVESSQHDGVFLMLSPADEAAIVDELEAAGHHCRRDERFVLSACGYGSKVGKEE